ncbi:hypothetical protein, partial [Lysinibacillus sp. TE18511]
QKRLIGRPQEALLCAKAKRQRQSAQSERKSTPCFAKEPLIPHLKPTTFLNHKKWRLYIFYSKYLKSRCSMNIQDNFSNPSQ